MNALQASGERFELVREIAVGETAVVYEATDRQWGRRVALKALRERSAEEVFWLKREFRALREIHHPNLIRLHHLVAEGTDCLFTMELIAGTDMVTWCNAAQGTPRWPDRVRSAFVQLASALEHLHEHDVLHCDLKPGNVLLDADGTLKVLDFGMVAAPASVSTAGTFGFMAPEQMYGAPLTAASDWYGFGVLLHLVATGNGPPTGTLVSLDAPTVPSDGLPTGWAPLIEGLLHRDPAARAGSSEVRATLLGDEAHARDTRNVFVGRAQALAWLRDALDRAGDGPVRVWVTGGSGIGKTHLVRRFVRGLDAVVLTGRCHPAETVRFNALDEVIDALTRALEGLEPDVLAEVAALDDVACLATLFPVLQRVLGTSDSAAGAREVRRRAIAAFDRVLGRLARSQPVVVWIDDVQWADRDSRAILRELWRRPSASRVLYLLSAREVDEGLAAPCIELGPLSQQDSQDMLASLGASAERVVTLTGQAAGHPLFLLELALSGNAASLPDAFAARLGRLPPEDRTMSELVCLGAPLPTSVLGAVPHSEPSGVQRLVDLRLLTRVTNAHGDQLEPYHDQVRVAVLAGIDAARAPALHRTLAQAWLQLPDPDPEALSEHFLAAAMPVESAMYAAQAAHRCRARLQFDRAAELYARALEHGAGADRQAWRVGMAECLALAGRAAEAGAAFQRSVPEAPDPRTARDLRRQAAEQWLRSGDVARGTEALRDVLHHVGERWPGNTLSVVAEVVRHRIALQLRGFAFTERDHAECDPDTLARIDALWSGGLGLNMLDLLRSAAFQGRFTAQALRCGEINRVVRALTVEAAYRVNSGGQPNRARGFELLRQARALSGRAGPYARAFVDLNDGVTAYFAGRWSDAVAPLESAQLRFRAMVSGASWELANCQMYRLWALGRLGRLGDLAREVPALAEDVVDRGDHLYVSALTSSWGNLGWLAADRPDEAADRARAAIAPFGDTPFRSPHYFDLIATCNRCLYQGDATGAWQAVQRGWPKLRWAGFLSLQFFAVELRSLRVRCAAAMVRQSGDRAARRALSADTRWLGRQDLPIAVALARLGEALAARASGEDLDITALAPMLVDAGLGLEGRALEVIGGRRDWAGVADPERMARAVIPA